VCDTEEIPSPQLRRAGQPERTPHAVCDTEEIPSPQPLSPHVGARGFRSTIAHGDLAGDTYSKSDACGKAESPLISIILPVYNGEKYLRESIDSCLRQSFVDWELIIVDDGSTDGTDRIIRSYKDARILSIRHAVNRRLPAALSTGFRQSRGRFLTWTSCDNRFASSALQVLLDFLNDHPEADLVYSDFDFIDERGALVRKHRAGPTESLHIGNVVGMSFLYRRSVYEAIGDYDDDAFLAEDYDYWLRANQKFRLTHLPKTLYEFRLHPDSLTSRFSEKIPDVATMVKARHSRSSAASPSKGSYQPILVAYRTWPWILVAVRSFREHFPECPLVVIDNNPQKGTDGWASRCSLEQEWLRTQTNLIVVENTGLDRSAGGGIDVGLQYCREHGHEIMIHFEPDCLISGRSWLQSLLAPCQQGAWMCGSHRRFYGPIHPTPSAWRTDVEWASFAHVPRGNDVRHPRFQELFQLRELVEWARVHEPHAVGWWTDYWDPAQRNWFVAAAESRAVMVAPTDDFEHFWYGSQRPPEAGDAGLQKYLRD
jgi:glycosyltransferase involved in cell wall biosynthesis